MKKKRTIWLLYMPVILMIVCIFEPTAEKEHVINAKQIQITTTDLPLSTPHYEPPTASKPPEATTNTGTPYLDIPLSKDLQEYTYNQCKKDKDLYLLVMAIMYTESGFDAGSIGIDGHDKGIMQIRDCNIADLEKQHGEIDLMNPYDNIKCGVSMIKVLYEKYEYKNLALMAYNCGEAGARKLWKQGIYSTEYSRKVTEYYEKLEKQVKE